MMQSRDSKARLVAQKPAKHPQRRQRQQQQARDSYASAESQGNLPEYFFEDKSLSSPSVAASDLSLPDSTEFYSTTLQHADSLSKQAAGRGAVAATYEAGHTDSDPEASMNSFQSAYTLSPLSCQSQSALYQHLHPDVACPAPYAPSADSSRRSKAAAALQRLSHQCKRAASNLAATVRTLSCLSLPAVSQYDPSATAGTGSTLYDSTDGDELYSTAEDAQLPRNSSFVSPESAAAGVSASSSRAASPVRASAGELAEAAAKQPQAANGKPCRPHARSPTAGSRNNTSATAAMRPAKLPAGTNNRRSTNSCKGTTEGLVTVEVRATHGLIGANGNNGSKPGPAAKARPPLPKSASARSAAGTAARAVPRRTASQSSAPARSRFKAGSKAAAGSAQEQSCAVSCGHRSHSSTRNTCNSNSSNSSPTAISAAATDSAEPSSISMAPIAAYIAEQGAQQLAKASRKGRKSSELVPVIERAAAAAAMSAAGAAIAQQDGTQLVVSDATCEEVQQQQQQQAEEQQDARAAPNTAMADSSTNGTPKPQQQRRQRRRSSQEVQAARAAHAAVANSINGGSRNSSRPTSRTTSLNGRLSSSKSSRSSSINGGSISGAVKPPKRSSIKIQFSNDGCGASSRWAVSSNGAENNNSSSNGSSTPCALNVIQQLGTEGRTSSSVSGAAGLARHSNSQNGSKSNSSSRQVSRSSSRNGNSRPVSSNSSSRKGGPSTAAAAAKSQHCISDATAAATEQQQQQQQQHKAPAGSEGNKQQQQQQQSEADRSGSLTASTSAVAEFTSQAGAAMSAQVAGLRAVANGYNMHSNRWHLVRVCEAVPCAAYQGTVHMETVHGGLELFQCNTVLQPGSLAAACIAAASSTQQGAADEAGGSSSSSRVWLFCPDPLCVLSKPPGSEGLPEWSWHLEQLADVQLSKDEATELQSIGIQVDSFRPL